MRVCRMTERIKRLKTREEALAYGLSFPDTYQEAPFHDDNWQLVRVKGSRKAFLWTYEKDGCVNLNVKTDPAWRDFWRDAYQSVTAGWHQNKEHWNTIILDGTIPEEDIRRISPRVMILSRTVRRNGSMKRLRRCRQAGWRLTDRSRRLPGIRRWRGRSVTRCANALIRRISPATESSTRKESCQGRSPLAK